MLRLDGCRELLVICAQIRFKRRPPSGEAGFGPVQLGLLGRVEIKMMVEQSAKLRTWRGRWRNQRATDQHAGDRGDERD